MVRPEFLGNMHNFFISMVDARGILCICASLFLHTLVHYIINYKPCLEQLISHYINTVPDFQNVSLPSMLRARNNHILSNFLYELKLIPRYKNYSFISILNYVDENNFNLSIGIFL